MVMYEDGSKDEFPESLTPPPATTAQLAVTVAAVLLLVTLLIGLTGVPRMAMPRASWVDTWVLP